VVLLAVVGWMVWEAGKWDLRARLFPLAVGVPALGLALLQLGFLLRPTRAQTPAARVVDDPEIAGQKPGNPPARDGSLAVVEQAMESAFGAGSAAEAESAIPKDVVHSRTREMIAWILAITAGIVLFGFELGAALLTFLFLHVASRERLRTSILIALATYFSFYILFDRALFIPFPPGVVADFFGTKPFDHYLMDPIADLIQNR
jgi:hypothetical protein